ncbi:hypothetical protein J4212_07105 [Candidatus Woesearchaeota archaeon]|nr:hypothetical protein [Candidatus Woesearchaeota archaeon]
MAKEPEKLFSEAAKMSKECNLCREIALKVGDKTEYGAAIICRVGSKKDGWFATLSPKTGSNPEEDFTIQIMPFAHLTHFSQIDLYPKLAENYGRIFSKASRALTEVMMSEKKLEAASKKKDGAASVAIYGKCTTWLEKKEHLHIKIFPFRGNIGQPYTVDSSFGKKQAFRDDSGEEFVKMKPVRKVVLSEERFEELKDKLIRILEG